MSGTECFDQCSKEEQLRRLDVLHAQLLETGPDKYSQQNWFNNHGDGKSLGMAGSVDLNECGTSACFAGHCASVLVHEAVQQGISFQGFVREQFDVSLAYFGSEHVECYFGVENSNLFASAPDSGWQGVELSSGETLYDRYTTHCEVNEVDIYANTWELSQDEIDAFNDARQLCEWSSALDYIEDRKKVIENPENRENRENPPS